MTDGSPASPAATLELSEEEMCRLGYAAVDMIVAHFRGSGRSKLTASPDGANPGIDLIGHGIPAACQDPDKVLSVVRDEVLADIIPADDPRFYAYIPSPSNFIGAVADALVSGFNVFAGNAEFSHGPNQVERVCIRWLCDLAGLPEAAGGTFVSGGSAANLTALYLARTRLLGESAEGGIVYCSGETHSSIERAARVVGLPAERLVNLPVDEQFRLPTEALAKRIAEDRAAGYRPFAIAATAGTTSTGAIDDLAALADIAKREGLWLHVDAAYGAGALLSPKARALFTGIERADSITVDQHKWFFQPFECASFLVRDMAWLREAFHMVPAYLKDSAQPSEGFNYRDHGLQNTRAFKALKLWMSLQTFGEDAFRAAVEHGIAMAETAEQKLTAADSRWQIVSPAKLAMVTFRFEPKGPGWNADAIDRLNEAINRDVLSSGTAFLSTTELFGRKALRLCTINPRIEDSLIQRTVDALTEASERLSGEAGRAGSI